ncbi:MAG: response regulator [Desulfuromonadaceae bacterium]|nr:response regulator [Desulfuromonadaceae bacterium]MDD2855227.1 response regulator [Desulfuromonadaceae bacterium]
MVILLVEDDPAHAEIVRRNLEGFRVANHLEHVTDGQEALDYLHGVGRWSDLKPTRPHIVLLDLRLPKVDGLEVLRIIKEDPGLNSIPVVILTTSAAESDMIKAYERRVNSYLVKPLDLSQFVELIASLGYYWLAWNKKPSA